MAKQKLPLGIQDFEELRKGNYLYVDKTDMLWKIANGDKYNFLSRPRRFGKSLLTSAMQCYFEGKKELFEGLKIMALEKEWVKRPVLHFSMNQGGSNAKSLSHYLDDTLSKYEDIYGRRPTEATLNNRLNGIIQRAYEQSGVQIAILVDSMMHLCNIPSILLIMTNAVVCIVTSSQDSRTMAIVSSVCSSQALRSSLKSVCSVCLTR